MTFLEWCRTQRNASDPVGDFARDWLADRDRPRAPTLVQMIRYLQSLSACVDAVQAAQQAHQEWRHLPKPGKPKK